MEDANVSPQKIVKEISGGLIDEDPTHEKPAWKFSPPNA